MVHSFWCIDTGCFTRHYCGITMHTTLVESFARVRTTTLLLTMQFTSLSRGYGYADQLACLNKVVACVCLFVCCVSPVRTRLLSRSVIHTLSLSHSIHMSNHTFDQSNIQSHYSLFARIRLRYPVFSVHCPPTVSPSPPFSLPLLAFAPFSPPFKFPTLSPQSSLLYLMLRHISLMLYVVFPSPSVPLFPRHLPISLFPVCNFLYLHFPA